MAAQKQLALYKEVKYQNISAEGMQVAHASVALPRVLHGMQQVRRLALHLPQSTPVSLSIISMSDALLSYSAA